MNNEEKKREDRQTSDQRDNDKKLPENSKESLDRRLDEGDEESFPASDPVSVQITK